jgi:holo-[acyl-carrier protein] synthase
VPPSSTAGAGRIRVGVDIVGVERMARLRAESESVLDEVFSPREQAYCLARPGTRDRHLAARFAAKEAVLKAFGTGLGARMRWTDVEIVKERSGRPLVELHGEVAALAERRGLTDLDVSVAHSEGLAVAHAVAVWTTPETTGGDALSPD